VDAEAWSEPLTHGSTSPGDRRERLSVLVVDDQRDSLDMLTEYLSSCGFLVHTAADGFEAITVAVHVLPSIVLMDLMMPRMDGWEATRRLKADARTRDIPIIAFSAHSQPNGNAVARAAGCEDLLRKPCDLDQLAEELRKRVDQHSKFH
jgi:two-component system cell cycle response regulator DivK